MKILLLDVDSCYLCPLCEVEFGWHGDVHKGVCRRTYDDVTVYLDGVSGRPKWCPLKPMPRKLDANDWHRMFGGTYKEREAKGYGWNACLEEIEK